MASCNDMTAGLVSTAHFQKAQACMTSSYAQDENYPLVRSNGGTIKVDDSLQILIGRLLDSEVPS